MRNPQGLPWTDAIDVFAAGCIIGELRFGQLLFPATLAHGDLYCLVIMQTLLNALPENMARQGYKKRPEFFVLVDRGGKKVPELNWKKVISPARIAQREKRGDVLKVSLRSIRRQSYG